MSSRHNVFLRFRDPNGHVYEERPGNLANPNHIKPGDVVAIENGNKWKVKYVEHRESLIDPGKFTPFVTLDPLPN